jgi:membrane protein YqaA with SNARE-associated domain
MNSIELYKSLCLDSFSAGLFFTLDYEYLIWVINLFGKSNEILIIVIASFGYMLSIIVNYLFGRLLNKMFFKYASSEKMNLNYKNVKLSTNRFWSIILILTICPGFGKFLFILLGFVNIKPAATLIFGTLLKSAYYLYYII